MRTKKEWMLSCSDCSLERVSLTRPRVGAFHWTEKGRCSTRPRLHVREVTKWQKVV